MRDSDPFWTFVLLGVFSGIAGTILLVALWDVAKFGAQLLDVLDVARTLSRPQRLDAGRGHR